MCWRPSVADDWDRARTGGTDYGRASVAALHERQSVGAAFSQMGIPVGIGRRTRQVMVEIGRVVIPPHRAALSQRTHRLVDGLASCGTRATLGRARSPPRRRG